MTRNHKRRARPVRVGGGRQARAKEMAMARRRGPASGSPTSMFAIAAVAAFSLTSMFVVSCGTKEPARAPAEAPAAKRPSPARTAQPAAPAPAVSEAAPRPKRNLDLDDETPVEESELRVAIPVAGGDVDPSAIRLAAFYTSTRMGPAYVRVAAQSMKKAGFNTVVANESFTKAAVDAFQSQGIGVITYGGKLISHPGVVGGLVGDGHLPGKRNGHAGVVSQYRALSAQTQKPLIACLPGEDMGLFGPTDPRKVWDELKPAVRCFRWYGISRSHYGILHKQSPEGRLAMPSVLSVATRSGESPYWAVLPAFGKTDHEAEHSNPTPAQITCMMHMALAYRAKGLLFWGLQNTGGWRCLVDEKTLAPSDNKLAAIAEVSKLIGAHGKLLASLEHGGLDIRCPNPVVVAVPCQSEGKLHVYAVNKDTRNSVTTKLMLWQERWNWSSARDVFSGTELTVSPRNKEGYLTASLALRPGEGKLIATDASGASKKRR